MRYVIIGNSAAGVGGAEGIRAVDPEGEIVMLSKEPWPSYSRPLISYLLEGKTDEERMRYRGPEFYERAKIDLRLGVAAEKLSPEEKTVTLSTGAVLPYDRVLVATGSVPFVPETEGLESVPKKFTFLSLSDALALKAALTPESRVLIVGAGLIGLKCAEGILRRVGRVQVTDLADRVLGSVLDEEAARRVQAHLEKMGMEFFLSRRVTRFEGDRAVLDTGEALSFDVLVLAAGVRPNDALLSMAGALCRRGAVTTLTGETTLPDVFAAGDCAQSHDLTTGEDRVLALLPGAFRQGECAGRTMAGAPTPYDTAMPVNSVGFFGLHLMTAGSRLGERFAFETEESLREFYVKDGVLSGFSLLGGDLTGAGVYTALIRERTPLAEVDFPLLMEKPQFMAFSPQRRRALFANG